MFSKVMEQSRNLLSELYDMPRFSDYAKELGDVINTLGNDESVVMDKTFVICSDLLLDSCRRRGEGLADSVVSSVLVRTVKENTKLSKLNVEADVLGKIIREFMDNEKQAEHVKSVRDLLENLVVASLALLIKDSLHSGRFYNLVCSVEESLGLSAELECTVSLESLKSLIKEFSKEICVDESDSKLWVNLLSRIRKSYVKMSYFNYLLLLNHIVDRVLKDSSLSNDDEGIRTVYKV